MTSGETRTAAAVAQLRRSMLRIAVEMLVGFVGVYAAFALSAYHEQQEVRERQRQVRLALIEELRDLTKALHGLELETHRISASYDTLRAHGRKETLVPLIGIAHFDTHMWNATVQGGGLSLMDVKTFYRLAGYYNRLGRTFDLIDQLRVLSQNQILPNLDKGPDEFFDPKSAEVRPKYAWYFRDAKMLEASSKHLTVSGDSLIALLAVDGR